MKWNAVILAAALASAGLTKAAGLDAKLPAPTAESVEKTMAPPPVVASDAKTEIPPPAVELEVAARKTLQKLAEAYSAKRRSAFMKLVSDDFTGDTGTLEDAILKDFRSYRTVNLDMIPDKVELQGPLVSLEFHYNLTVISAQGVNNKFSGRSNYVFRWEDGKVRLYKMERPILFGNSLSPKENPIASSQNSPSEAASTVPGAQGTVRGSATVTEGSAGYKFDTQANVTEASADIHKLAGDLEANPGGGVVSIGFCSLESVTSVSPTINGNFATANVGECYAVRTPANKYAALRITSIAGAVIGFVYKFQPGGPNTF